MTEVERPVVLIQKLDPELPTPGYARPGDAGMDLVTAVDVTIAPGERVLVPTGVALAIPEGWVGLIHPRSGLAARHGLTMVNTPGTIDAGYRGEVQLCLLNTDPHRAIELARGDRAGQIVFQRVGLADLVEVDVLPPSDRGSGGFGSTGGFTG
ncbi:dUTP diphosphatase [Aestuariimicrobium sp. T2.26MG-19.2B]|uniref:dUTP diphosphatase n=1 Tax=Aestuariimicrobium sp. T2.26MG-19.2B TaxID=3040679 RepID=UPI002477544E|nr:dUTP diphosphatase [Aestuariimicrobium sp. T2.26MG-19.2B]CAI9408750.1 Deoxyuridine 5'-triphosphate nucleotidohydrolase [Aestuariimicrobium sp. T2.26MG-19.2B]